MSPGAINAFPTKELFIDTLVRDVSTSDAILDLVDNAIDGYTRKKYTERKEIKLNFTKNGFQIWDNCGGIDIVSAKDEVFRFGVRKSNDKHSLGVYGIGLKNLCSKWGKISYLNLMIWKTTFV